MATIRKRSVLDRYTVTEKYLYSRAKALTLRPNALGVKLSADNQVYGAVIDMPMPGNMLGTLVCLANGTANLYFNNGNSVSGLATKYRSVSNAARSMTSSIGQILPACERVIEFDLPPANQYYVYLLTRKGIYKTAFNPTKLSPITTDQNEQLQRFAYYIIRKTMNEVQNAQMKEQKNK